MWLTGALIREASALPAQELDRPLALGEGAESDEEPTTLRDLLDRLVFTKEMRLAAMTGGEPPSDGAPNALPDLARRWQEAAPAFLRQMEEIRDQGRFDDAFIDAVCVRPETFTCGGALAHVVTRSTYRRGLALGALRRQGVAQELDADPVA